MVGFWNNVSFIRKSFTKNPPHVPRTNYGDVPFFSHDYGVAPGAAPVIGTVPPLGPSNIREIVNSLPSPFTVNS